MTTPSPVEPPEEIVEVLKNVAITDTMEDCRESLIWLAINCRPALTRWLLQLIAAEGLPEGAGFNVFGTPFRHSPYYMIDDRGDTYWLPQCMQSRDFLLRLAAHLAGKEKV